MNSRLSRTLALAHSRKVERPARGESRRSPLRFLRAKARFKRRGSADFALRMMKRTSSEEWTAKMRTSPGYLSLALGRVSRNRRDQASGMTVRHHPFHKDIGRADLSVIVRMVQAVAHLHEGPIEGDPCEQSLGAGEGDYVRAQVGGCSRSTYTYGSRGHPDISAKFHTVRKEGRRNGFVRRDNSCRQSALEPHRLSPSVGGRDRPR